MNTSHINKTPIYTQALLDKTIFSKVAILKHQFLNKSQTKKAINNFLYMPKSFHEHVLIFIKIQSQCNTIQTLHDKICLVQKHCYGGLIVIIFDNIVGIERALIPASEATAIDISTSFN